MKASFRLAVAHLVSQPKLIALAAVIAVGANIATGYIGSTQGQVSGGGGFGGGGAQQPISLILPIIVDDGDEGFTPASVVTRPTGFSADNRTVAPNMWAFNASAAGTYDVYATWIAAPANNTATSYIVSYRINTTSTSLPRVFVNQILPPDDALYQNSNWEKIGSLDLTAPAMVTVLGATEQNAYIDAMALVLRTQCNDGLDNDGDGFVDFPADFSCGSAADNDEENIKAACQDAIDNDADGRIDFGSAATNDIGCTGVQDNDEYNIPIANITTTKMGPASVMRGENATYIVSVLNRGPDAALGLELRDTVPTGMTFVSTNSTLCSFSDGVVVCRKPELPSGQIFSVNMTFAVSATLQCGAVIENRAEAETITSIDNDEDDNISAMVRTTVTCPQCSDTVDNDSDGAVDFPADFSCGSADDNDETNAKSQCQDGIDNDGDGRIDAGTAQTNDAGCTSKQDNDESNAIADMQITKSGPAIVTRSGTISYTVTVANAGPAAARATVADAIPAGLVFTTSGSSEGCVQNGTNIICNTAVMNANQNTSITLVFTVPATAACNSVIQNQATVSTAATDPNVSNNLSQTINTMVVCPTSADLSISKFGPASVTRSGSVVYTLMVTNAGPDAAYARIIDPIPAGLTFQRLQSSSTCAQSGASIVCNSTGALALGQGRFVNIAFNVPNTFACNGVIQNRATVSSGVTDPNAANNQSATVSTTVTCPATADLSITKSGPSTVVRGGRVSYTLTAMNAGPSVASNIIIADPIPAGLVFVSGSSSTICAQNGTNILCSRPEALNNGQSASVTIVFTVPSTFTCNGTIQNQASVSTATTDSNPGNNQSQTVSTTVTCPAVSSAASSAASSVSVAQRGNLYVNAYSPPIQTRHLLAGTVGEPVFDFTLRATKENMDVRRIILTNGVGGTAPSLIESIDLYRASQTTPFATATVGGCGSSFPTGFCAVIPAGTIIIPMNETITIASLVRLKTDAMGVSNLTVRTARLAIPGYYQNSLTLPVIQAVGVVSGMSAVPADNDTAEEGEVFVNRVTPGPSSGISSVLFTGLYARISSITNGSPAADGTAVPTGLASIGEFKFFANSNANTSNGLNKVRIKQIRFFVEATNVLLGSNSVRVYNKADSTMKSAPCTIVGTAPLSLTGTLRYTCNLHGSMNADIESGGVQSFVIESSIVNPKLSSSIPSRLQVSLDLLRPNSQNYTWVDVDNGGSSPDYRNFDLPYQQVLGTRYDG